MSVVWWVRSTGKAAALPGAIARVLSAEKDVSEVSRAAMRLCGGAAGLHEEEHVYLAWTVSGTPRPQAKPQVLLVPARQRLRCRRRVHSCSGAHAAMKDPGRLMRATTIRGWHGKTCR